MSYFPKGCNPCRLCGGKPELVSMGYGNNHDDIRCTGCGQHISVDFDEKHCRKAWNEANPTKETHQ